MAQTLPYKSIVTDKFLLNISTSSIFKIYFINIVNRIEKEKYMWEYSSIAKESFIEQIKLKCPKGVGFIIAFPHICKIFSFGPVLETNLYAISYKPSTMEVLNLQHNNLVEIACFGEIVIAADEFFYWANSSSVDEYLEKFSEKKELEIKNHTKLNRFLI